jgi:hypothetical protein
MPPVTSSSTKPAGTATASVAQDAASNWTVSREAAPALPSGTFADLRHLDSVLRRKASFRH